MNPAMSRSSDSQLPTALRLLIAGALMALAANCFLKYLWWTACYSAWRGIPKLADQWRAAGARASLNGWGVMVVGIIAAAFLSTVFGARQSQRSPLLGTTLCLALSLVVTIAGTGAFALVLSWLKQGVH
jgi:hypothetical protein